MFVENNDYEILTPTGWQDFRGVTCIENKKTFRITLENNAFVEATAAHVFFRNNEKVKVSELQIKDTIDTIFGSQCIVNIEELENTSVFDVIEVDDPNHQFIVNSCFITRNCDEFSFLRPSIAKEFWASISPTLSTGGKAIITSTPNSDDDQFADIWRNANKKIDEFGNETKIGVNGFAPFLATWEKHPDRDENWARQEEGRIGRERFEREHLCRFLIFDETLINSFHLAGMQGQEPILKQGQVRWYEKPKKGMTYLVALDPSLGTGGDNAAIQVFQLQGMKQIGEWMHNKTPITKQVFLMREITKFLVEETEDINSVYYTVENNTLGEAALQQIAEIGEENIPGIFLSEPYRAGSARKYRKGFNTTNSKKLSACAKLKHWIESGKMSIVSKPLISELKTFISSGASYAAKVGETDDLVTSTLLIVSMAMILKNYDPLVDAELKDPIEDVLPLPFIVI